MEPTDISPTPPQPEIQPEPSALTGENDSAPTEVAESPPLGLRRHFTTAGVHPYDQLEWELRDARIKDHRDGSVVFEQKDVEFPRGWSLNATNIVSQKYFRGALGAPERENSLKQIIDRVVDRVTTWGDQDRYFESNEERETFRDELKYLLASQKLSFNSPVWFNIGVEGVPQQASACFILSVEDTMPSILNWYVEEGLIFKGGSGAGINLRKLRSSPRPEPSRAAARRVAPPRW